MYKYLILISIAFSFTVTHAQDTIAFPGTARNLKAGVYKNYNEFLIDNPSIQKELRIIVDYTIDYVEERKDTIKHGFTYEFLDSSEKANKYWGVCDGKNVYVKNKKQGLVTISFIGKYSFAIFDEKNNVELNPLLNSLVVSAVDALISPKRNELYYFNDEGVFLKATDQSVGWLLRKDKDLSTEFNKEKLKGVQRFRKYIELMNKKYPLR